MLTLFREEGEGSPRAGSQEGLKAARKICGRYGGTERSDGAVGRDQVSKRHSVGKSPYCGQLVNGSG